MANHNDTGKKGEQLAVDYLKDHGFDVLYTNWRFAHFEIDIIATCNNILHFVEVKARRSTKFGLPEESVSNKKIQNLINAAEAFLYQYPEWKRVQFDVLSVMIYREKADYFFIEDVYL
ncbi:MAG: YraN family protein [Chitinophagaceae bacterium]|nr:YraN family protein [Chitinophagaceae bacterium]